MVSPNVQAEQQRIMDAIAHIRGSGEVAPAYCWLTSTTVVRSGKTYEYARLVSDKPGDKPRVTSLGRHGSVRHRHWQLAIARREAIAELEQQLKLLQELVARQSATWSAIERLLAR